MTRNRTSVDERIGAIARNQADLTQSKENFMLSMQFFKEELNDMKNSLNKLNDRLMNIPAAAGGIPPRPARATRPHRRSTRPP